MKCKDCGAEMKPLLEWNMYCPNDCDRKPKKEEVPDYVPAGFTGGPWWNCTYVPIVPDPNMPTGSFSFGGHVFNNITMTTGSFGMDLSIDADQLDSGSFDFFSEAWKNAVDSAFDRWSPFEDDQEEE